jgi:hypothetical protein
MRKCPGGGRRESGPVRRFKLENQRHNGEANRVNRQLTLCHIMTNKAVVRVVIGSLWNVPLDG